MPNDLDVRGAIKDFLSRGRFYSSYEIQGYLHTTHKRLVSESACTARIRDLRKPEFGGHRVICRHRADRSSYEYSIPTAQQEA